MEYGGLVRVIYGGKEIHIAELVRTIFQPAWTEHYDPWFARYHRWLGEDWKLENYIRYVHTLLAQAGAKLEGARVLDAGCGFGLTALFLHLLGAVEVHGLDCHAGMIRTFQTYLSLLNMPFRVYPCLGDVAHMPYGDAYFDIVLSMEAVSHYRNLEAFLDEIARVLRPGGHLIIADGNNARHTATRRRTREIWTAFENGPAAENIHGHRVEKPFVEMRREIIAGAFPDLSPAELDMLARQTSGLAGEEVLAAVRTYRETGRPPGRVWDGETCPLDPVNGYYIERLLDPLELGRRISQRGFRTVVRPYFGGARGGMVHAINDLLTHPRLGPLMLNFTPSFRILARKEG